MRVQLGEAFVEERVEAHRAESTSHRRVERVSRVPDAAARALRRDAGRRAARDQHRADREERQRPRDRAEEREVVDKELHEREPEEPEAGELERGRAADEAGVEQREPDQAPQGADRGVAALEVVSTEPLSASASSRIASEAANTASTEAVRITMSRWRVRSTA